MTYRFEYDSESGAIYVRVRDGEIAETVRLADPGFGAAVDVDEEGWILGIEFLSFEEFAELVASSGGELTLPERLEGIGGIGTSISQEPRSMEGYLDVLMRAISKLEPMQQEVLHLLYMEDLSVTETAERLGHSVATTRSLRVSALRDLRAILTGEGTWEEDQRSIEDALSMLRSA